MSKKNTNNHYFENDTLIIETSKGQKIYADISDYNLLKKYSWCITKTGYAVANINHKVTKMHRYILGLTNKFDIVDHKNGNPLDNRRSNIRLCSLKDNARNCRASKGNSTGIVGVSIIKKTGRYRARIMVEGKEIRLGNYETIEAAAKAREAAEIKFFGEYAPTRCRIKEV